MRSKAEIVSAPIDSGIIAVVRTQNATQILPVCEALLAGGVIAIEVMLTVPNALEAIRIAAEQFGNRTLIGVGTVL